MAAWQGALLLWGDLQGKRRTRGSAGAALNGGAAKEGFVTG